MPPTPSRDLLPEILPENTYNWPTTSIQLAYNSTDNFPAGRILVAFTHGVPDWGKHWLGGLVRWWLSVPYSHVTVAAGGYAVETTVRGTFIYDATRYCTEHPGLCAIFELPVPRDPVILRWGAAPPIRLWKIVLRVATFGWFDSRDCVCTAIAMLIAAGLDVPPRIRTPRGLYRWLIAQGHTAHVFCEPQDDAAQ